MNSQVKQIAILLLLCLTLIIIWFHNGLIFASGEEGIPFYNLQNTLRYYSSLWHEVGVGFPAVIADRIPFFSFLEIFLEIGIKRFIIQALAFFILIATGTVSMYFLIKETIYKEIDNDNKLYKYFPFVSAIFYLLNPFSMTQIFGRSAYMQFFPFALFPLFLTLVVLGFKRRKFMFGSVALVLSTFLAPAFGNLSYVPSLWFLVFIYVLFYLKTFVKSKKDLIFTVTFIAFVFGGWILINLWWILPNFNFSTLQSAPSLGNIDFNLGSLRGVSKQYPLPVLIRLMHTSYFFEGLYGTVYSGFVFGIISWIIPLLSLFAIKKFVKLSHFKFFLAIFLISIFICLGSNFPTGILFEFFFQHLPYFQIFRNPYEKFGLVLLIAYTPIFSLGLLTISEMVGKRLKNNVAGYLTMLTTILLICGVYVWPMWSGYFAGGFKINTWIRVPDYYKDLQTWLDGNGEHYRIIMTPLWTGDASYYSWDGKRYQGSDPMVYLLSEPTISYGNPTPYDFVTNLRKYMGRTDIAPSLSLLRAKFLVNRGDATMISDKEKDQYKALTSGIYSPNGLDSDLKIICQNQTADSKTKDLAWVVCRISSEGSDLSNIKYLRLKIKTDVPANLELSLRDNKDTRVKWDGRKDLDYTTDSNDWNYITIPLDIPSENDYSLDLSKITMVEVWAQPKDNPEKSVGEINISEIKLDPGVRKEINEFKQVAQFGSLTVYEQTNFNPSPEFGNLSAVSQVKDFPELFEEANRKRDLTDKEGFILISQNSKENLQALPKNSSLQIIEKSKISDSKYYLKVQKGSGQGLFILSKSFNPGWKVIPGISRDKLSGNIFDNLYLLGQSALPEDSHYTVNGYANLWNIDGRNSDYVIVFMPQIIADVASKVSILSVLSMTGFIIIWKVVKFSRSYRKK